MKKHRWRCFHIQFDFPSRLVNIYIFIIKFRHNELRGGCNDLRTISSHLFLSSSALRRAERDKLVVISGGLMRFGRLHARGLLSIE